MNFTECQHSAYSGFLNGENIFISGPGGCGKSYFIQQIYEIAKKEDKNIKVTSLTGCSAILLNCKATTIHKWGGLGLGTADELSIYRKLLKQKKTTNYLDTDILVIDEISMLNQYLFEVIDYLCKKIRKCTLPFGGIQIIASGDFYQLPPVCKDQSNTIQANFCFQSKLWDKTFETQNHYIFDINFRQNDDPHFFELLQEVRTGKPSFDTISTLVSCSSKEIHEDNDTESKPTRMFPIKKTVDKVNNEEFDKLLSKTNVETHIYNTSLKYTENTISDKFIQDKDVKNEYEHIMKNGMFENKLSLCVGCQVMCISNINQDVGLVNGSQGIIQDFICENNKYYPNVKFDNISDTIVIKEHSWTMDNNNKYSINQLPLILSWAITIHKSQGMSIDKAIIDIGGSIFQYGQTYVALSRVKNLQGLYLTKVNAQKIKAHPEVIKFYQKVGTYKNTQHFEPVDTPHRL